MNIKAVPILSETLCEKCRYGKTCVKQSTGWIAKGQRCKDFARKQAYIELDNDAIKFCDKDGNVVAQIGEEQTFILYDDKKLDIKW